MPATFRNGVPKNGIMQLTEKLGKTFFSVCFATDKQRSQLHTGGFENVYQMSKYLSELDSSVQSPSLSSKEKQFFFPSRIKYSLLLSACGNLEQASDYPNIIEYTEITEYTVTLVRPLLSLEFLPFFSSHGVQ